MALLNHAKRELNAKIVYYGPGLCGKTTNIKYIFGKLRPDSRGKLLSLATQTDRTLFFDFLPVDLGEIMGFKTRFHLYTVPGQVFYNSTRKLVLKGVDGIVFVADSQRDMLGANLESLQNLRENLAEHGTSLEAIPWVIQCNKRDLPDILPLEELDRALNPARVPLFGGSALEGKGVFQTLTTVSKMVLHRLRSGAGNRDAADGEGRQMGASYRSLRKGSDRLAPEPEVPPPPPLFTVAGPARMETPQLLALPLSVQADGREQPLLLRVALEWREGKPQARLQGLEGSDV